MSEMGFDDLVERVATAMMRKAFEEMGEPTMVFDQGVVSRMDLCGVDMRKLAAVAIGEIAGEMADRPIT